ncbi:TonB-dependent receptor [Polymorphobacter glacialis]|uniref:TonB-dependent receptor n=1 Tax=Sandarakinorhabdus glacialis TaxID=1614636 RepID=A0A917A2A1_9SPHN|nr:TonB-dependent receptor [Polymorphobacter glacialis]
MLTLRGVGFYDSTLAASPAVSVYLDEAPLALPSFLQVGVIDIARVEVLKGPQGTLYGENSTGGAINYVAAKPTDTTQTGTTISFGRFATFEGESYVSGPLSETLKARLAVKTVQSGDWQRSFTRADTNGAMRQSAARAIVEWEPSSGAKVTLNVNGWIDRSDTQGVQLIEVACASPPTCRPALKAYPPAPDNARAADWTPGFPMSSDDHFFQTTLRADIDLTDAITLTSISGYQRFRQRKFLDQDGTALQVLDFGLFGRAQSFNQELRLAGETGQLRWLVGGYATRQITDDDFSADIGDVSIAEPLPGIVPRATTGAGDYHFRTRSLALFGNLEYRLDDRLTLIGGLRYTASRQQFDGCEKSGADPALGQLLGFLSAFARGTLPVIDPVPPNGCISIDAATLRQGLTRDQLNENNVSWRAGLNYQTAADTLVYASVAKGYKSGSFPSLGASSSIQFLPVTQESLLAYEAGVKMPLGNFVRVEAAAFYYDYRDKQVRGRVLDAVFGAIEALVNIPQSRVYGFEAAVRARPVPGLGLGAGLTFTDSQVQRFSGIGQNGLTTDFAGSAFPYSPRWQAVADATYDWSVGADRRAFVGGNITHHSTTNASLGDDPELRLQPYVTLDLRAGLRTADGRWSLSAFGRNVTNVYYWNNMFRFVDTRIRIAARPATYGLTLSIKR